MKLRSTKGAAEVRGEKISGSVPLDFVRRAFREHMGPGEDPVWVRAPGRVNLIGEHTDYNDGFVLPMTTDRAVYVALRQRADRVCRFHSLHFNETVEFRLDRLQPSPASHWSDYVKGVLAELSRLGLLTCGLEGVIYGDLPISSGLSSSAALEVAVAFGAQSVLGFPLEPVPMALACQRAENEFVGVRCGIMDQFAARLGRKHQALFLDCRTLQYRHVPLSLEDACIVIADTGVRRPLTESGYNTRRAECEEAVAHFRRFDPSVTALRDVTWEAFVQHNEGLAPNVRDRCIHVLSENQRVLAAIDLLERGELEGFGERMNTSHESLRDLYQVSCPELDLLVEAARAAPGVLGARMTGAGFGGCTVNLVRRPRVQPAVAHIREHYAAGFGRQPEIYVLETNAETARLEP